MKPDEVWVIFNKVTCEIKLVFAERFLADRVLTKLLKEEVSGTIPNDVKLTVCTLNTALAKIDVNSQMTEMLEARWQN